MIVKGDINDYFDFIEYCRYAKRIDISTYDKTPSLFLEKLCREISSILPELLNFTHFFYSIQFVNDSQSRVTITIGINGKMYQHEIRMWNNSRYEVREFYKLFNKALAVQNADKRLCMLINANLDSNEIGNNQKYPFYLIALTVQQQAVFNLPLMTRLQQEIGVIIDNENSFSVHIERDFFGNIPFQYHFTRVLQPVILRGNAFDDYIVTPEIWEIVNQFKATGIFEKLSPAEFHNGLLNITLDEPFEETDPPSWILRSFSKTLTYFQKL